MLPAPESQRVPAMAAKARRLRALRRVALLLLAWLVAVPALAQDSGFIPADGRVDIAYDTLHQVLFISGGPQLRRFDMRTRQFLPPMTLGGMTWGMDISADGKQLAVANLRRGATQIFVDLIDLEKLKVRRIGFAREALVGGTYGVAFDRDGMLLVSATNDYGASAYPDLLKYDPRLHTTLALGNARSPTLLTPSADHTWIAVAEENSSAGPYGRYATGDTSYFTNLHLDQEATDIAISPDGAQTTIATGRSATVLVAGVAQAVIGVYPTGPLGVAYSPTKPSMYLPFSGTSEIAEYDTVTLTQIGTITAPGVFNWAFRGPFDEGRTKVSADGGYLFSTLDGGVFYAAVSPLR